MKKIIPFLPVFLFLFITILLFRPYFFSGKVPFAGNLLVSFYEPWKSYSREGYPNGPANKPIGFDSLRIFYPLRQLTIESFRRFQLPLWNPYDFSGNMHLATYQSAVFFPLTPLFFFLPLLDAWSLVVVLGPFLVSLCTYYFLRSMGISVKGSILGALTFGFSGTILVLIEESFMAVYSILSLPIILLGIQKFFYKKQFVWFGVIVGGVAFSLLSGWFQSSLYVLLFSISWSAFLLFQTKEYKRFLWVLAAFGIAFLVSAPHLLPNAESFMYSARGTTDAKFLFTTYLVDIWHIITYVVPDFFGNPAVYNYFGKGFYYEKVLYIGIVGFFFGLIAFLAKKKSSQEVFFSLTWIITLSLGIALPTSWFLLYTLHIPLISTILPSRIFILSSFSLAVLAGYGWDAFFLKKEKLAVITAGVIPVAMVLFAWGFVIFQRHLNPLGEYATVTWHNLFLPTGIVLAIVVLVAAYYFFLKQKKELIYYSFLLLAVVGIFLFGTKYLYFSDRQFTYPKVPVLSQLSSRIGYDRFVSYGRGYIDRNFATYFHLQSPEGYDSFYIKRYGEFVEATKNQGRYTSDIIRADAQFVSVGKLAEISNNQYLVKALDLLGVRYVVAKKSDEDDEFTLQDENKRFSLIWSDGIYSIFENKKAFPRAFLVNSYSVTQSPQETFSKIFNQSTDLHTHIVLAKKPSIPSKEDQATGLVKIISYQPEKIVIDVNTPQDTLLFLSDNDYPGWQAYVDNKKTEVLRADYAFRSIVVPKGKHAVVFLYQPISVVVGFILSGIGLLLFVGAGLTIGKNLEKRA